MIINNNIDQDMYPALNVVLTKTPGGRFFNMWVDKGWDNFAMLFDIFGNISTYDETRGKP